MTLLETARLRLRWFNEQDADHLFDLDHDPGVTQSLQHVSPPTIERIRTVVIPRFMECHERSRDIGFFAAELLEDSQFVGWFHLRPVTDNKPCFDPEWDEADDLELGCRLRSSFWGLGLATEGSCALVDRAFNRLNAPAACAFTMPENKASIRVMEKAGLEFSIRRRCPILDTEIVKYRRVR